MNGTDCCIRLARPEDADAVQAIYAPIVRDTFISFETDPPDAAEMRARIARTLGHFPWLVYTDAADRPIGYAYASRLRERAAYQWACEVTAYVHESARGQGVGRALYECLLAILKAQGYVSAFAGIALPNAASVALHESVGFRPLGTYRNVGFKLGAWRDVGWWQRPIVESPPAPDAAPLAFPLALERLGAAAPA